MSDDWNTPVIAEFRANNGVMSGMFAGWPMLLLRTTGAKSGAERVNPMVYFDQEARRFVFASFAGNDRHPDWYHNLVANPEVTVELGTETYNAHAKPLGGAEHDRIYALQAERFPVFTEYQAKTHRIIPVVELERRA